MPALTLSPRVLLITLTAYNRDRFHMESELAETIALIETYGGEVISTLHQNESHLNAGTYIGRGKVAEVAEVVQTMEVDVVVLNAALSSSQLFTLKQLLSAHRPQIEVWDRVDLILHIFKKHAKTAEAKLQIKLAETRHKGPEIHGIGRSLSQQGGGIGSKGRGETQSEIMKRHWRSEIQQIESELEKMTTSRLRQMEHRKRLGLPTISIVGYTNAGKSTLFNLLTKKDTFIQNAPFATLDSSVGKFYLHALQKESFITDTIGFIQNLSAELIQAFQSTLAETVNADILLHVIDLSDSFYREKIQTVETVLGDLGVDNKTTIFVFNKIDSENINDLSAEIRELSETYQQYSPQFVSALNGSGIPELIDCISSHVRA